MKRSTASSCCGCGECEAWKGCKKESASGLGRPSQMARSHWKLTGSISQFASADADDQCSSPHPPAMNCNALQCAAMRYSPASAAATHIGSAAGGAERAAKDSIRRGHPRGSGDLLVLWHLRDSVGLDGLAGSDWMAESVLDRPGHAASLRYRVIAAPPASPLTAHSRGPHSR